MYSRGRRTEGRCWSAGKHPFQGRKPLAKGGDVGHSGPRENNKRDGKKREMVARGGGTGIVPDAWGGVCSWKGGGDQLKKRAPQEERIFGSTPHRGPEGEKKKNGKPRWKRMGRMARHS